jgi:Receptor family ligand binding region
MDYDHVSSDSRRIKEYSRRCRPDRESLAKAPYNEDPKLAFVINSILAVVHGLDKMHKQVCNGTSGLCPEMVRMNSSLLMHFMKSSRFTGITGSRFRSIPRSKQRALLFQAKKSSSTRTAMVLEGMTY